MSGSYIDAAAATEAADSAKVQSGVATATAQNVTRQSESARFIAEHGAAVIGGHSVVDGVPAATGKE